MCTGNIIAFGNKVITRELIHDKFVLDVGAYDVNGTLKNKVMEFKPKMYVGVDIREGPNVDVVCDICDLEKLFLRESYNVVICTEVLEHVKDWQKAVYNLKQIVAPGGSLLITTPTIGFPYHEYPSDHWRFTLEDFKIIFIDFDLVTAWTHNDPGVCILLRKPMDYVYVEVPNISIAEVK